MYKAKKDGTGKRHFLQFVRAMHGATAIDLKLTGGATGEIIAAFSTAKLFVTLGDILSGGE